MLEEGNTIKEAPHDIHGESDIRDLPKDLEQMKFYEGCLVALGWAIDFIEKMKSKGMDIEEIEKGIKTKHGIYANLYTRAWKRYNGVMR